MPTLRPTSTLVTIAVGSACTPRPTFFTRCVTGCARTAWLLWSGQRMPTGATLMQSTQIGRPHSEHDRPVSRSGWR